ncbi:MAG: 23S rRNA (guanosine(2251)-2'-O)-methyltransferase RlmB [Prevotella sp.]|nr:23S rRNA (guanosine(2251)-2'-O)-methyltransferase RlmB [Staphylococcus sp.]MCM1350485.1 23S rRNA (guanosine(2251)-2'-O)-methyltransferase RlmB [Prevotella sp.]
MYIYGKNTVIEALKTQKEMDTIYLSTSNQEMRSQIESYLKKQPTRIIMMPLAAMNQKFSGNHQGIVASVKEYQYATLSSVLTTTKQRNQVALAILDGLEDPHNLGAILRTADATQMDGIIIPKNRSVGLNATVAKVSTGAIEHIPVVQATNLVQTIETLKEKGFWIIGLEMDGSIDYKKQDYSGKIAIVIGSEGKGISRLVKEHCDFFVHIPMLGHVTSLNASVSASIIFYEIVRNRLVLSEKKN